MRARTIKALLFIAILAVLAADFSVGCGQGYVYGPVTQKYSTGGDTGDYLIAVSGSPYAVPPGFYALVKVGDVVKFDGKDWSIVKPGETAYPSRVSP